MNPASINLTLTLDQIELIKIGLSCLMPPDHKTREEIRDIFSTLLLAIKSGQAQES